MKNFDLLKAITLIDDKYVEDALNFNDTPTKHPIVEPNSDFVIENETLVAYTGAETEIILPDGVITIGSNTTEAEEKRYTSR